MRPLLAPLAALAAQIARDVALDRLGGHGAPDLFLKLNAWRNPVAAAARASGDGPLGPPAATAIGTAALN